MSWNSNGNLLPDPSQIASQTEMEGVQRKIMDFSFRLGAMLVQSLPGFM